MYTFLLPYYCNEGTYLTKANPHQKKVDTKLFLLQGGVHLLFCLSCITPKSLLTWFHNFKHTHICLIQKWISPTYVIHTEYLIISDIFSANAFYLSFDFSFTPQPISMRLLPLSLAQVFSNQIINNIAFLSMYYGSFGSEHT